MRLSFCVLAFGALATPYPPPKIQRHSVTRPAFSGMRDFCPPFVLIFSEMIPFFFFPEGEDRQDRQLSLPGDFLGTPTNRTSSSSSPPPPLFFLLGVTLHRSFSLRRTTARAIYTSVFMRRLATELSFPHLHPRRRM